MSRDEDLAIANMARSPQRMVRRWSRHIRDDVVECDDRRRAVELLDRRQPRRQRHRMDLGIA